MFERLIQVLVDHNNIQRQQIKEKFKFMYDTKLIDEIKGEYSGIIIYFII